jgi:hypothetical protein
MSEMKEKGNIPAAEAISRGQVVYIDSNGELNSTNDATTNLPYGVAQRTIASGSKGGAAIEGIGKCLVSGAVSNGEYLVPADNGHAVAAGNARKYVFARCLEDKAEGAADLIEVQIFPAFSGSV